MTSHLEQEIQEQPRVLAALLEQARPAVEALATAIHDRDIEYCIIAARGTSDNAATYGKYIFGSLNGLPVGLAAPSLFTLYRKPPRLHNALVIGISQSGKSSDIVEVVQQAAQQGALTAGITNDPDSPLAQIVDHTLELCAGSEQSIAATKTYTAQVLILSMLAAALSHDDEHWQQLNQIPNLAQRTLEMSQSAVAAAERYRYMESCVVIGRGYNYATASEIALKLKELTYVVAEPYSSADFMHGPLALIEQGFPVITIAAQGLALPELRPFLQGLVEREAELIMISDDESTLQMGRTRLPIPPGAPEWLTPVITVMPGQLFAFGLTLAKGFDPDHPRGLKKVTQTR